AKKIAVIFSHIFWDAGFFYGDNLFEDYEKWLVETTRAACANPNVNWIIKLHPANTWKLELDKFRGELPEVASLKSKIGPLPEHIRLLPPETDINGFSFF